jgi:hypothetical protein
MLQQPTSATITGLVIINKHNRNNDSDSSNKITAYKLPPLNSH